MKTRFTLLISIFLFGSLFLMACSSNSNTATSSETPGQSPTATTTVSSETKLAVGTIKLSGTEQDITTTQATELLTLWKAYQTLSDSDTTAQFELDSLIEQIEETMTSEQIQAIDEMQITTDNAFEAIQSAVTQTSSNSGGLPAEGAAGPPDGTGGAPIDGGTPPDGEMMGDTGMAGADLQTASDTVNQNVSQMTTINPTLINTLVQMLQDKSQVSS